ncbi:hypothetical protein F5880DRAFT_900475 [Lentinula raphanica]|nr:hypothetical protein F5880DRAFT_900475 [Lentinula raphanica]
MMLRELWTLILLFLFSSSLTAAQGTIPGVERVWNAGMPLRPMDALDTGDIRYVLPREAMDPSNPRINAPLTFSLTTDSTFMSSTTASTSSSTVPTGGSTSVSSSTSMSTRSVPSFTPTTTSTMSSSTTTATTTTSSSSSSSQTSSSSSSTTSSSLTTSTSSTTSVTSSSSSQTSATSTSSFSSSSSAPTVPPSTSSSSSTVTATSSPSSTTSMTDTMTSSQSHTTMTSSTLTASSGTGTTTSSSPTSSSSSSVSLSVTGTSSTSTSSTSQSSTSQSSTSQLSNGGTSTGMTSSTTQEPSSTSGSESMSQTSTSGTILSSSSQLTGTPSTIGTTSPPVSTGSFSPTASESSISSNGAGSGTGGSSSNAGQGSSASGLTATLSQTSPASSSSSSGVIGTGSSSGLSKLSSHLSTILPIVIPLVFLILLLSAFYLCRRKQLRRGMNVFGQRLELGETPEAWWRLGESNNATVSNVGHEARTNGMRNDEKPQSQRRTRDADQTVPIGSEKRSIYAVAASIVGRVGVPPRNDMPHDDDIGNTFPDEEKENLTDKSASVNRTRGGPISTLTASVVKHTKLPVGKRIQNKSGDLVLHSSDYGPPSRSPSTPMLYPTPPSSRFSSRNHSPLPSLPFTFYRASRSTSRTESISPIQDVPTTATDTDVSLSDQLSYTESVSHSRLDPDDLEAEVQMSGQEGYIPIMRTATRGLTDSSTSSVNGMEYIPFMNRDSDTESYAQMAPRTPSTRSLDLTRTHTSQSDDASPITPRYANPSENSCVSRDSGHTQETRDTRDTGVSYGTQSTVETTSSLSFVQPKLIRPPTLRTGDGVSGGGTTGVPLVTSTFHYSPDPDDEDDIALGSSLKPGPGSGYSSNNPFHPSNALFQSGLSHTLNQDSAEESEDTFTKTLEWRRRAMVYADNTGQRPSLMEAVEVYFSSGNSNTDSSPSSPGVGF